eukprot:1656973-Rhodomonas_salina.1
MKGLPHPFYTVADSAYTGFTGIVCPYAGNSLMQYEDSLNFHISQVCIEIKCAFRVLYQRWGILWQGEAGQCVGNVVMSEDVESDEDTQPVFNELGCPADGLWYGALQGQHALALHQQQIA